MIAALLTSATVNAGIISDYTKSAATSDGWTVVYQGAYNASFNYGAILDSIDLGAEVALASSSSASAGTYDLLGWTTLNILQTFTGQNQTIYANDAYWYRNSLSVGFAPSAFISQTSADTANVAGDGDLRLSWHTWDGENVFYGWRSGLNTGLNSNSTWQRYILVREALPEAPPEIVPEPASLALIGLGLLGLAASRRKSSRG